MAGEFNKDTDMLDLPEECIATAVGLTTPRDACQLASVSSAFKSAADSDAVWSNLLPPDIDAIISRSTSSSAPVYSSLKELYFYLCDNPILLDDGKLSFSLSRSNGKKCYMISPRALSIAWGDDPRYWRWTQIPSSRFQEVAQLDSVFWLDISGRINLSMLSSETVYAAYIVFQCTADSFGLGEPAQAKVGVDGAEQASERTVCLDGREITQGQSQSEHHRPISLPLGAGRLHVDHDQVVYPRERSDGWLEMELGEFFNRGAPSDAELVVGVKETRVLNWKRGLIVQGIELRPQES